MSSRSDNSRLATSKSCLYLRMRRSCAVRSSISHVAASDELLPLSEFADPQPLSSWRWLSICFSKWLARSARISILSSRSLNQKKQPFENQTLCVFRVTVHSLPEFYPLLALSRQEFYTPPKCVALPFCNGQWSAPVPVFFVVRRRRRRYTFSYSYRRPPKRRLIEDEQLFDPFLRTWKIFKKWQKPSRVGNSKIASRELTQ